MGVLRVLPAIDEWLDADAESWSPIFDRDYVTLVRQWRDEYLPLIAEGSHSFQGVRAMQAIAAGFRPTFGCSAACRFRSWRTRAAWGRGAIKR